MKVVRVLDTPVPVVVDVNSLSPALLSHLAHWDCDFMALQVSWLRLTVHPSPLVERPKEAMLHAVLLQPCDMHAIRKLVVSVVGWSSATPMGIVFVFQRCKHVSFVSLEHRSSFDVCVLMHSASFFMHLVATPVLCEKEKKKTLWGQPRFSTLPSSSCV